MNQHVSFIKFYLLSIVYTQFLLKYPVRSKLLFMRTPLLSCFGLKLIHNIVLTRLTYFFSTRCDRFFFTLTNVIEVEPSADLFLTIGIILFSALFLQFPLFGRFPTLFYQLLWILLKTSNRVDFMPIVALLNRRATTSASWSPISTRKPCISTKWWTSSSTSWRRSTRRSAKWSWPSTREPAFVPRSSWSGYASARF